MIQNDLEPDSRDDGLIVPHGHAVADELMSPTSSTLLRESRLRTGFENTSSSDYMQQFRRNSVSYGVFLASYWDHLPQKITRVSGEKKLLITTCYIN